MIDYQILWADNMPDLATAVDAALKDNWRCAGGIAIAVVATGAGVWAQALTRDKRDAPPATASER